jgi:hypothetical protein
MELFRFMLVRPPVKPVLIWSLDTGSPVQESLKKTLDSKGLLAEEINKAYFATGGGSAYIAEEDSRAAELVLLQVFMDKIEAKIVDPLIDPAWFRETANTIFAQKIDPYVGSAAFLSTRDSIYDTLVAIKMFNIVVAEHHISWLVRAGKAIHFLDLAAYEGKGHPGLKTRQFVVDVLQLRPSLPVAFDRSDAKPGRKMTLAAIVAPPAVLVVVVPNLEEARRQLAAAKPRDHVIDPAIEQAGPSGKQPLYLSLRPEYLAGNPALGAAVKLFNIDLSAISAPDLYQYFLVQGRRAGPARSMTALDLEQASMLVKAGSQWLPNGELEPSYASDTMADRSYSAVRPVGVADLLIVRQRISGYEFGEIAHVENVLESETRSREHERHERMESETMVETETSESQERDLQTTERHELKNESEHTVKQDSSLEAGVSLSASYGAVTLSTNLSASSSTAVEDAQKQATTFAKDVVSRAASRSASRTLTRRTEKKLFEIVEKNIHQFNNSGNGKKNITGIYQWLNKVYTAQTWNYGKRMLYEIIVPEPAALWKANLQKSKVEGDTLFKPPPFNLSPSELTEDGYTKYVGLYGLSTNTPPPNHHVTIAKAISKAGIAINTEYTDSFVLDVPKGYTCNSARIAISGIFYLNPPSTPRVIVTVGTSMVSTESGNGYHYVGLDGEIGQVAVLCASLNYSGVAIAVEITCYRTPIHFAAWQADMHAQLMGAYRSRLSEYETELERRRGLEESGITGSNPLVNDRTVRGELKRNALVLIRHDNFSGAGALVDDPATGPAPDLQRTNMISPTVLFFEQAFEWEQMTYRFYEYFWGAKDGWKKAMLLDDHDDNFRQFLRSGACRLILPVRRGFEEAVAHYFETGVIWTGQQPPPISSPTYTPIIDEIRAGLNAPNEETAYGKSWKVIVPTDLVALKSDDKLPVFAGQPLLAAPGAAHG